MIDSLFGSVRKIVYLALTSLFIITVVGMVILAPKLSAMHTDIARTEAIRAAYTQLLVHLLNIETGMRGYVLVGKEPYLEPFYSGQRGASASMERLKTYPRTTPQQSEFIDKLLPLAEDKLRFATDAVNIRRFNGDETAEQFVATDKGKVVMDQVRAMIAKFDTSEERRLHEMHDDADHLSQIVMFAFLLAALSFVSLLLLVFTSPSPPRPPTKFPFPWDFTVPPPGDAK